MRVLKGICDVEAQHTFFKRPALRHHQHCLAAVTLDHCEFGYPIFMSPCLSLSHTHTHITLYNGILGVKVYELHTERRLSPKRSLRTAAECNGI